jgi:hypothetical protein
MPTHPAQVNPYVQQINIVIDHVREHLDDGLSLGFLAAPEIHLLRNGDVQQY